MCRGWSTWYVPDTARVLLSGCSASGVLLGNEARDEVEKKARGKSMNGFVVPIYLFLWTECLCFPFLLHLPSNSYAES